MTKKKQKPVEAQTPEEPQEETLELSKFFQNSEVVTLRRSEIKGADYNPRSIDDEGRRYLKRSLNNFGCVGGIVVNKRTGNTVVGGHQKIALMDEYHKYPEKDYLLRAEVIDVDEKTEKTLNIALNNPNVGGYWDYDKMRELIPDVDYKAAGLNDADLNMIGVDFLLQTQGENDITNELGALMAEADELHRQEVAARKEERQAQKAAQAQADNAAVSSSGSGNDDDDAGDVVFDTLTPEQERQAKIDHMKDVKQQVREQAMVKAQNMDAYVVVSFDNWDTKAQFCQRFGFDPYAKFIKGEVFDEMVERVE